jgi:hypothetical protein
MLGAGRVGKKEMVGEEICQMVPLAEGGKTQGLRIQIAKGDCRGPLRREKK